MTFEEFKDRNKSNKEFVDISSETKRVYERHGEERVINNPVALFVGEGDFMEDVHYVVNGHGTVYRIPFNPVEDYLTWYTNEDSDAVVVK